MTDSDTITTNIPQRLDRLPWSAWHLKVVTALGITWLLDGLEVTLAGSLASFLTSPKTLGLSDLQVGAAASAYLIGAVTGALFFGWLTDRWGRQTLFFITLALYVLATAATAFAWNFWSFWIFRAMTGMGIGGEYAAINSAIDELIPARVRGPVDLLVNATFWIGAILGALGTLWLLQASRLPVGWAWRLAFGIGALLGLGILFLRRHVPESPRWLMLRGRLPEAEAIVSAIERQVASNPKRLPEPKGNLTLRVQSHTPLHDVWTAVIRHEPKRSILGLMLMVAQAFFYNAIFFTYGLVLTSHFKVPAERVPLFILPLAVGNFLGPIVLGHLFDSVGRKAMIALTYGSSGTLLAVAAALFGRHHLSAGDQAVWFSIVFFIASSASSAAYLTVSEIFPLEIRAFAISLFYAAGTLIGGLGAPFLFAHLIATGSSAAVSSGYLLAALLMILGAGAELLFGVRAERQSLESISSPLNRR